MKKIVMLFTIIIVLLFSSCAMSTDTTGSSDISNNISLSDRENNSIPAYVKVFLDDSEYTRMLGHKYYIVGEITDYYCNFYNDLYGISLKESYIIVKCGDEILTVNGYSVGEPFTSSTASIESSQYLLLDDSIKGKTAVVFFTDTGSLPVIQRDDVLIANNRSLYYTPEECLDEMRIKMATIKYNYSSIQGKKINSVEEALIYTANQLGYSDISSIDLQSDKPCLHLNGTDYLEFREFRWNSAYTGHSRDSKDRGEYEEYYYNTYPYIIFDINLNSADGKHSSYELNINGQYIEYFKNEDGAGMIKAYDSLLKAQ